MPGSDANDRIGTANTHILSTGDIEVEPSPVPHTHDDPLAGRTIDGRYRVTTRLGAGGVGVVYAGEHVEIKKAVAIKVLHQTLGQAETLRLRFEREARAASRLSHPACVSVIDFGRIGRVEPPLAGLEGTPYLVMERVRGDVLADRIGEGPLPAADAIAIVRGVLSALRHAHGLGLVHRDVKPGNVMLSPRGEAEPWVKLLDFGLAKSLVPDDDGRPEQPLTEAGMVFGTPGYLSPEQACGKPLDARSDLYSVGVVLFELCCGRPPFVHTEKLKVVRDHLLTAPPSPRSLAPTLSAELEQVILRALTKDPAQRYATADAFIEALMACPEAAAPGAARPVSAPVPAASPPAAPTGPSVLAAVRARLTAPRIAVGLAGLGLLVLAITLAGRRAAPPPAPAVAAPVAGASRHLALALDYERRLWCSDALDELERAVRDDARLGQDPSAIRVAVGCLRQKTQAKAIRFLVESSGPAALPALREVEARDGRPDYRAGAARAIAQLSGR